MSRMSLICVFALLTGLAVAEQKPLDACRLAESLHRYDGRVVVVTGLVTAEQHSTAIGGADCSKLIVIRYKRGSQFGSFERDVESKRLKLESRPLQVVIRGKLTAKVCSTLGCFARIDVTRVLQSSFLGAAPSGGAAVHESAHSGSGG